MSSAALRVMYKREELRRGRPRLLFLATGAYALSAHVIASVCRHDAKGK